MHANSAQQDRRGAHEKKKKTKGFFANANDIDRNETKQDKFD
jgi:hypothetical protein